MKIKQYLILSFGTIMAATLILGTVIFFSSVRLRAENERVRFAQTQLMLLKDIRGALNGMLKEVSDYMLIGAEELEEYNAYNLELQLLLSRLKQTTENELLHLDDDEKEEEAREYYVMKRLRTDIDLIIRTSEGIIDLAETGDHAAALNRLEKVMESIQDHGFANVLRDQIKDEELEIHEVNDSLMNLTYNLQLITVLTIVLLVLVISVVGFRVMRSIQGPIAALLPAIEEIGKGNFKTDIPPVAHNEIGTIAAGLKDMADELHRIRSQLVQSAKMASVGQLAAGIAHELNQPLMVIRMNAQMLIRQKKKQMDIEPGQLDDCLNLIERNTGRMRHIIDHLRTFSRQTDRHREPVDIHRVIEASFTMINEQLRIHNIEVATHLPPDLPKVHGNINELEQVFLNLVSNSKDALIEEEPSGPRCIEISATPDETGQAVEVTVTDTGAGIPPESKSSIFDPFYTTKPVGKGTGLGLSIVYGIVQEHDGSIELADTGAHGTTFRVRLPVSEDHHAGN